MSYIIGLKLNNKILRVLQNRPVQFPVVELFQAYKTLPIAQLHFHLLLLAMKILHHPDELPNICRNYMELANDVVHTHVTRMQKDLHIYRANITYGQRCLKYKISKLWNELPYELKTLDDSKTNHLTYIIYLTTKF